MGRGLVVLAGFAALAVCFLSGGCELKAKATKTVELSQAAEDGALLSAETYNGIIDVAGEATDQYSVTATIEARATTEEKAAELLDATTVEIVREADGFRVKVDTPKNTSTQFVGVKLEITVPKNTPLVLTTHNGAIYANAIEADVKADTHNGQFHCGDIGGAVTAETRNGRIVCKSVKGDISVEANNGSIDCDDIQGNIKATSNNGSVSVSYAAGVSGARNVTLTSNNGSITLSAPKELSAKIEAVTHNGRVKSSAPIVITHLDRSNLQGTLGAGEGKVKLESHNGSITLR